MSQLELRVTSGKQAGSSIPLEEGKFLVGREEDCHLRPNSDLVSRHHCVFTVDEYGIRLRDLGSTNGTFLNGERIKGGVTLKLGDKVSIGKLEFELVDPSAEATSTNLSAEMNTQITEPDAATADEEALNNIISGAEDSQGESAEADEPSTSETMTDIPQMSPGYAQQPPPEGDTQFMQPGMPMPQMGYPMGYPQQMMPYGYPQYPPGMYPQQMGYPQQMPGMYPQQPMPEQQQPEQGEAPKVEEPAIRLPDPTTTGAKVEPPKPADGGGEGNKTADQKSKEEAPGAAGDIIQQYLNRRPSKE